MVCRSLKTPFQLFRSLRAHSEHENSPTLVGATNVVTPTLVSNYKGRIYGILAMGASKCALRDLKN